MSSPVTAYPDRGPNIRIATSVVAALATVFVALRAISRGLIVRHIGKDDISLLAAWLLAIGLSTSIIYGTTTGLGRHDDDIPSEWEYGLERAMYTFTVLYNPALMATKNSILMFYLRLTSDRRFFRRASIACLLVVNAAGLAFTFLSAFQCHPIREIFANPTSDNTHCTDMVTLYLSSAPVNILTDLAILLLPMPLLTGITLPSKQKIFLVATFALGSFVTVVGVVRLAFLQEASTSRLLTFTGSSYSGKANRAWYAASCFMWSAVEVNVGIICACIPTLKALLTSVSRKFDRYATHSRSTGRPEPARSRLRTGSITISIALQSQCQGQEKGKGKDSCFPTSPLSPFDADVELREIEHTNGAPASPQPTRATAPQIISREVRQSPALNINARKAEKSLVHLTNSESAIPVLVVTTLFFLWGFAYGLLVALNGHFQSAAHMDDGQTVALHCTYFVAYFLSPVTFTYRLLVKCGFKTVFMTGLCIFAVGSLVFWPSAILGSFPGFVVSNFVVALGLSTLEIAANPFVALCGPPEHAEARLNLAQAGQAVGTVLSPLLASFVLFKDADIHKLVNMQWTYLAISLFAIALAMGFYYYPLPEVDEAELEVYWGSETSQTPRRISVPFVVMIVAAIAQFGYVGGQEAVSPTFTPLAMQWLQTSRQKDTVFLAAIAHTIFAFGRIIVAGAFYFLRVNPQLVLVLFVTGIVISSALTAGLGTHAARIPLVLIFFFQSAIYPTIFVIALRGQGRHVKLSAACQVTSIVGGALAPAIQYVVQNATSMQISVCVSAAFFSLSFILPIYATVSSAARRFIEGGFQSDIVAGDDESSCHVLGQEPGDESHELPHRPGMFRLPSSRSR